MDRFPSLLQCHTQEKADLGLLDALYTVYKPLSHSHCHETRPLIDRRKKKRGNTSVTKKGKMILIFFFLKKIKNVGISVVATCAGSTVPKVTHSFFLIDNLLGVDTIVCTD